MSNSPYETKIKIDISGFENKLKNIQKTLKKRVRVGVLHAETYDNGATTADVASWNEGDGDIRDNTPQRSVIGLPLELYREEIIEAGKDVLRKEGLTERGVKKALKEIGKTARDAIVSAFDNSADGKWAENAPSTVKRKGFNRPMVETGTLASNIEWEVIDGE